jgi:hypothetical protein
MAIERDIVEEERQKEVARLDAEAAAFASTLAWWSRLLLSIAVLAGVIWWLS